MKLIYPGDERAEGTHRGHQGDPGISSIGRPAAPLRQRDEREGGVSGRLASEWACLLGAGTSEM